MSFEDTNNEFTDGGTGADARLCPYCGVRPLTKRRNTKTCGSIDCGKMLAKDNARKNRQRPKTNHDVPHGICPWCNTRPIAKRSNAKTCGAYRCKESSSAKLKRDRRRAQFPNTKCPYCNDRPLANRKDAKTCGDHECRKKSVIDYVKTSEVKDMRRRREQRPDVKSKIRAYHNEYVNRPDVKQRLKQKKQTPEALAKRRAYSQRPDVIERRRERDRRPDVKAKRQAYEQRPDVIARRRERRGTPEAKTKRHLQRTTHEQRLKAREYKQRPEVKAYYHEYFVRRGRPYPRGWGGPTRRWEMQRRMCAMGRSEFDGRSYRAVGKKLDTDHLVPLALLKAIDITGKDVRNTLDNIWVITSEKNRGIGGKKDKPLHHWLTEIGEPKPVVDMGRAWYEHTVNIIVAKQQAIDPTYELSPERRAILGLD